MITACVLAGYAVAWLLTARLLYGRWRAALRPLRSETYYRYWSTRFARESEVAARAMAAALAWPLVLLAAMVTFRPPPNAAEQAAAKAKLAARVAELETELGIKP